jgi:uncharacterized heparinase superfamily protein
MLRFFRHGDGGLAQFNGGSECDPRMVEALLARDEAQGQSFFHAPHSCYQRLASGKSIALMDCGAPPAGPFSVNAHAGCLAFEFSSAEQRIVVNCGTEFPGSVSWSGALRATAAHSTVTLADVSMATLLPPGPARDLLGARLIGGPTKVVSSRVELAEGWRVDARHDGYATNFGIEHERSISLSPRGNMLSGLDRLVPVPGRTQTSSVPFAARFHIHPDVRVSPSQGGGFLLKSPNGEGWRFRCTGDAAIEESVYLGSGVVRRAEQFVISGKVKDSPIEFGWAFEQMNII